MRLLAFSGALGAIIACGGSGSTPLLGDGGDNNPDTAAPNDANPASDSATEGGKDGSSCPDFCASVMGSLFCSDFDAEMMPTDWSVVSTTNGGMVSIEQTDTVSCPNALGVSLPQVTAGGSTTGAVARVTKAIVTGSTIPRLVLKLEAWLPSNDTMSYVSYFGMRPTAEAATGIYLTHHADAYWFLTNASNANIGLSVGPLTGAWNEITLDVVFGNPGKVTLTYTGSDNAVHMVQGSGDFANNPAAGVTVDVGMVAYGQTEAAFDAYYDNVVVVPSN